MLADELNAGLELMMLGMGIVFVFLTILIFALRGMTALANWLHQEPPQAAAGAPAPRVVTDQGAADPAVMKVIEAAVKHYRQQRKA